MTSTKTLFSTNSTPIANEPKKSIAAEESFQDLYVFTRLPEETVKQIRDKALQGKNFTADMFYTYTYKK